MNGENSALVLIIFFLFVSTLCAFRIKRTNDILIAFNQNQDRGSLQCGDLVLFAGNCLLRCLLNSPFTHVGMVVESPGGQIYLWEINPTRQYPTLTPIQYISTPVYVRSISTPLPREKVWNLVIESGNTKYDFGAWRPLVKSTFGAYFWPRLPSSKHSLIFFSCADMVGSALQEFGCFSGKNHFVPEDFSSRKSEDRWGIEKLLSCNK